MKLAFAMLADSASALPDGKINIQGGDIDTVRSLAFPALQPMLALVVQLITEPSDREKNLRLTIEGKTPQNEAWFPTASVPVPWKKADRLGRPAKHSIVINLPMLVFLNEGKYTFHLLWGDTVLASASLPLYAERVAPTDDQGGIIKTSEG